MRYLVLFICLLSGCQSESERSDLTDASCSEVKASDQVQWQLLLERNCQYLFSYQLFENQAEPRANARSPGIPFDLAISLFTDYANKYRFVFIPDNQSAIYQPFDNFDFPVGTVLAKTFALPKEAGSLDKTEETVIETRLLIHRVKGWVALPYRWKIIKGQKVAELTLTGESVASSMLIAGQQVAFNYQVPSIGQCKTCHLKREQNPMELSQTIANFVPIGLKARHLNHDIATADMGEINQLSYWQKKGLLSKLPDLDQVSKIPMWSAKEIFNDSLDDYDFSQLQNIAKGYLDINCSHCHNPAGAGEESGMFLEYWRAPNSAQHGICKRPGGFNGGDLGLHYDIVPGFAEQSILPYRMSLLSSQGDNKGQMPPLARNLNHLEGIELIRKWIDRMPEKDCLAP